MKLKREEKKKGLCKEELEMWWFRGERERVEERHNWALHLELNAVCLISCDNRNPTTLPCPSKAAKAKKMDPNNSSTDIS